MRAQDEAGAVRGAAGLFRRPECGLLEVTGADRTRWLDGMLTNDVTRLAPGRQGSGCPALVLTRTGRIVADPHVLAFETSFWLALQRDSIAATREALEQRRQVPPGPALTLEIYPRPGHGPGRPAAREPVASEPDTIGSNHYYIQACVANPDAEDPE